MNDNFWSAFNVMKYFECSLSFAFKSIRFVQQSSFLEKKFLKFLKLLLPVKLVKLSVNRLSCWFCFLFILLQKSLRIDTFVIEESILSLYWFLHCQNRLFKLGYLNLDFHFFVFVSSQGQLYLFNKEVDC